MTKTQLDMHEIVCANQRMHILHVTYFTLWTKIPVAKCYCPSDTNEQNMLVMLNRYI